MATLTNPSATITALPPPPPQASQQDLALAFVAVAEGVGCAINSRPRNVKAATVGGVGGGLLVGAFFLMGTDFALGAYAASAVAVALGATYVLRLLAPPAATESAMDTVDLPSGAKVPFPRQAVEKEQWPKEYAAFNLIGCLFGLASFLSAASYV